MPCYGSEAACHQQCYLHYSPKYTPSCQHRKSAVGLVFIIVLFFSAYLCISVASEAYHDWSGEAAGARLRVNFTLKLLLSQNFCNQPLMRFISFASNIGPAAAVPAGPAPPPLYILCILRFQPPWGPASLQYLIMQAQLYFRYSFEHNRTPRCS